MAEQAYSVILRDVSLIDLEDLKAELPAGNVRVVQPGRGDISHNELATILVLTLSADALTALTMWLLRTHAGELIDYNLMIRRTDGTEMTVRLKLRRASSEAPKSQLIKQIAAALNLPEDAIVSASAA